MADKECLTCGHHESGICDTWCDHGESWSQSNKNRCMKEEKAMKILEMFLHKQCDLERTKFAYDANEVWEAVKIASEALEKQIAGIPNIEGDGYADGFLVYDTWYCPNCDKEYEIDYDDYDYCPNCGKHIKKIWEDWSVE